MILLGTVDIICRRTFRANTRCLKKLQNPPRWDESVMLASLPSSTQPMPHIFNLSLALWDWWLNWDELLLQPKYLSHHITSDTLRRHIVPALHAVPSPEIHFLTNVLPYDTPPIGYSISSINTTGGISVGRRQRQSWSMTVLPRREAIMWTCEFNDK